MPSPHCQDYLHGFMPSRPRSGLSPGESIELECARHRTTAMVAGCVDLLRRRAAHHNAPPTHGMRPDAVADLVTRTEHNPFRT
jgi:hypothetical protein